MPFSDLHGHRRLVDLLSRSIARGTLPPSLIFAGPSGPPTRDVAIALAQAVNCETPVHTPESAVDSCGRCHACRRIARGVHPDVLVVEPGDSGAIKIDQIRDVIERSGYRPFEGRRRVVIVDGAEALVAAAQNALLKTLEEPPASSMFVLLTPQPDRLLATVRSRCIRLTFAENADGDVDTDARDVARQALAHAAAVRDPARRLEGAKALLAKTGGGGATDREQLASHLLAMASLVRDAEVVATGAGTRLANADVAPEVERLAGAFGGDRGVQAFAAIGRALEALERNAGVKLVADWLMVQL